MRVYSGHIADVLYVHTDHMGDSLAPKL